MLRPRLDNIPILALTYGEEIKRSTPDTFTEGDVGLFAFILDDVSESQWENVDTVWGKPSLGNNGYGQVGLNRPAVRTEMTMSSP